MLQQAPTRPPVTPTSRPPPPTPSPSTSKFARPQARKGLGCRRGSGSLLQRGGAEGTTTETTVKNTGSLGSSPRRGASPRELVLGGVAPACHPSGGSVSGPRPGGLGPAPSNADLAPTLSERSPLSPGRRPGRLGRTMRGETSQAGNRARKTRRRSRRGEHAGELEGGPPKASGPRDRHAPAFGSPDSAGAGVRAPGSSRLCISSLDTCTDLPHPSRMFPPCVPVVTRT